MTISSVGATGLDEARRWLRAIGDQAPYALARALTFTAKAVQADEIAEMKRVFDRPTPYTLSGTRIESATKAKLQSKVAVKDIATGLPQQKFLSPEVYGGARNIRASELALQALGILPSDWMWIPGHGATLDIYGNMSRGHIVEILAYFRANAQKRKGGRSPLGYEYFVVSPGGKSQPGIYKRTFFGFVLVEPVMIFVSRVTYKERYQFHAVGARGADSYLVPELSKAIDEAIRTG